MIGISTYQRLCIAQTLAQLHSVNRQTVQSQSLEQIIDYTVKDEALECLIIQGVCDKEIHLRAAIDIAYEDHTPRFSFTSREMNEFSFGDGNRMPSKGGDDTSYPDCPEWREMLRTFVQLAVEQGLRLQWAVRFSKNSDEYCQRFNLQTCCYIDRTIDGSSISMDNSIYPHLSLKVACSPRYGGSSWR